MAQYGLEVTSSSSSSPKVVLTTLYQIVFLQLSKKLTVLVKDEVQKMVGVL